MTELSFLLKSIQLMQHAIGLKSHKIINNKFIAHRNYFMCSIDSSDFKIWEKLSYDGMAEEYRPFCFRVTKKGIEFLEYAMLGIRIEVAE